MVGIRLQARTGASAGSLRLKETVTGLLTEAPALGTVISDATRPDGLACAGNAAPPRASEAPITAAQVNCFSATILLHENFGPCGI
jgi:hypothetical protein